MVTRGCSWINCRAILFGALGTGEQAAVVVSDSIVGTSTDETIIEGTANCLSGEGLPPRLAYDKVVDEVTSQIVKELFSFRCYIAEREMRLSTALRTTPW